MPKARLRHVFACALVLAAAPTLGAQERPRNPPQREGGSREGSRTPLPAVREADALEIGSTALAELPRVRVESGVVTPKGKVLRVAAGGDLQRALTAAKCGDVVTLAAGATYSGNFVLPLKSCTLGNPVVLRTVQDASDPPEGTRMRPSLAARLAKLVSPRAQSTLITAPSTAGWRLMLLEITVAAVVPEINAIVSIGDGSEAQRTLALVPTDVVLDRVYVHGQPQQRVRRCIALQSARTAVVDSWIDDCHSVGQDAQAIVGWNGPGPYKIENNYLAGSGENVMFGGSDPAIPDLVPSDIEFKRNHVHKPIAWKGVWLVKNLFEIKNAQRVLVEGNVFDGSWVDGQVGWAFNLKSTQDRNAPWSVCGDVTIRSNRIRNVGGVFSLSGAQNLPITTYTHRLAIMNNVAENINTGAYKGIGRIVQALDGVTDVIFAHNTLVGTGGVAAAIVMEGPKPLSGWTMRDNVIDAGTYGVKTGGVAIGNPSIDKVMPGSFWARNALFGQGTAATYPRNTFLLPNMQAVRFQDVALGNYRLAETSPYRTTASDGADLGVDMDALDVATAGVVVEP